MAERRAFTLPQVSQHKSNRDCWVVINGRVLDITKFLIEHPGGDDVLLEVAGKDATKEFDAVGHSKEAQNLVLKYQVGVLQGAKIQEIDAVNKEPKSQQEMSAFVIKEDTLSKSEAFYEFFVPLAVATLYFGYRFLTRADPVTY